jgi:phospholipid/cholesterol/gamma-HCH transport system permease protein
MDCDNDGSLTRPQARLIWLRCNAKVRPVMNAEIGKTTFWQTARREGGLGCACTGAWIIANAAAIDAAIAGTESVSGHAILDLGGLSRLDTAGAHLIVKAERRLAAGGATVERIGARPEYETLLELVTCDAARLVPPPPGPPWIIRFLGGIGQSTVNAGHEARDLIGFIGLVIVTLARLIVKPWRLRLTSLVFNIEQVGFNAMPIIGLLSFLIGVVMAYQGADQLARFGAQIYVVNLLGISVLRELGVLMTSIIVAGRSGSAFTAQIGSMKLREEIDAMRTIGLDPVEVLVLPRVLALIVALPLLTFFADIMGLLGGALMAWSSLDLPPRLFLTQLQQAVELHTFFVGLIKAPVFAMTIAIVGCYMGMKVSGSAESVGKMTTASVVLSIFLVIVIDAFFSVFFSMVGL